MLKHLRQLASESLVYGLGSVVNRFITIFLVPLYTRALTPDDYGAMSLIRNTTILVGMLTSLSLDSAAQRFYFDAEDEGDRKRTIASWTLSVLVLTTIGAIIITIFADTLATALVGNVGAARPLRLAAWTVPFGVLSIVYTNRLRMQRRPWAFSRFAIGTSVLGIVLVAFLVLALRRGIEGVFAAQLIASVGVTIFLAGFLRDWIHPRDFDWQRLKAMLRYAIPIVPAALAFWIIDVIDRYFLQVYTTTAQVGIYEIGYSIAAAVALGTAAFQQAWYPFAMSIQNVPRAREVYAQTFVAYTCVGCFACAGVTLFAPEAIRLLTTKAYYDAGSVVACLAFGYFFMGLTHVVCVGAALKKQTISIGAAVLIGAIVNIALNFWLIPAYGRNGAAVATLLGYIVVPVYMYRRAQRIYPIPYRLGQALMIIVFAVAVILAGSAMNIHDPWLAIMAKLGLLSLFFPLPFVLRIVTLSQFRTFARSAVRPFQAPANAIPPQ